MVQGVQCSGALNKAWINSKWQDSRDRLAERDAKRVRGKVEVEEALVSKPQATSPQRSWHVRALFFIAFGGLQVAQLSIDVLGAEVGVCAISSLFAAVVAGPSVSNYLKRAREERRSRLPVARLLQRDCEGS